MLEMPIDVTTTSMFTYKSAVCLFDHQRKLTYNGSIGMYDHDDMIALDHFDLDRCAGSWKVGRKIGKSWISGTRR